MQALTKEWYVELEKQSASNFINLPLEFQMRGYDYSFISKSYLNFFNSTENTRQDKLVLAKKFLKFLKSINRNRAKEELCEEFFEALEYFYSNFSDLMAKQDMVHLESLSVMTDAIDKSSFVEDVISLDDLKRRVDNLKQVREKEDFIEAEWENFQIEYNSVNS